MRFLDTLQLQFCAVNTPQSPDRRYQPQIGRATVREVEWNDGSVSRPAGNCVLHVEGPKTVTEGLQHEGLTSLAACKSFHLK